MERAGPAMGLPLAARVSDPRWYDGTMLPPGVVDAVLLGLGLEGGVRADRAGLEQLYAAWCERIPFDNVLKRLHLAERWPGRLPGSSPADFFRDWMEYRTGGTCWAGNGALFALCQALGFEAERAVATMMSSPDAVGPNHGTVIVHLDGARHAVDASILSGAPLRLPEPIEGDESGADDGAATMPRAVLRDGRPVILWRTPTAPHGFVCRIDRTGVGDEEWDALHQRTAAWSPFNVALSVRVHRGERAVGYSAGRRFEIPATGAPSYDESIDPRAFLVDELRMDPLVVDRLPPDTALPPRPPGF